MQRLIEAAGVAVFTVVALLGLARLAAAVDSAASLALVALAAPLGWLVTDFLSGLTHWAGDTWGSVRTPFLGGSFIRPFREHHAEPLAMTRHGFVEINGACSLGALLPASAAAVAPLEGADALFTQALLLFTALGIVVANQCHKWAHMARVSPLVRVAQRMGLILSSAHHRIHHTRPHDKHYCTASGWMNRPLQAIGFFPALERLIARACGAVPRDPRAQRALG